MAFFPRGLYGPAAQAHDASFTPLFRLLDDFDSYSRQTGDVSRRTCATTWQPKFDIRETAHAYELHGELPGMGKENLNIEFTEPQTMVVRGKTERTYTAGSPPNGQVENARSTKTITDNSEPTGDDRNSHQATVEDETDAETNVTGWEDVTKNNDEQPDTPKETAQQPKKTVAVSTDKAKYWLTERSIGEFARTFSFPHRIDQEGVTASLTDGVLSVVVPKAKKHEAKRINIV